MSWSTSWFFVCLKSKFLLEPARPAHGGNGIVITGVDGSREPGAVQPFPFFVSWVGCSSALRLFLVGELGLRVPKVMNGVNPPTRNHPLTPIPPGHVEEVFQR